MTAVERSAIQPVILGAKEYGDRASLHTLKQLATKGFHIAAQWPAGMHDSRRADDVYRIGKCGVESRIGAYRSNHVVGVVGNARQLVWRKRAWVDQAQLRKAHILEGAHGCANVDRVLRSVQHNNNSIISICIHSAISCYYAT
jgi:hypothetical protein